MRDRASEDRTDILFRQWLALAGVSYGISENPETWPKDRKLLLGDLAVSMPDTGYAQTIFVLHSYVALCSKLMAGEALALTRGNPEQRPSQWAALPGREFIDALTKLESGQLAQEMGAPNMMGGDLFGWYADLAPNAPELIQHLRDLFGAFSELGWARLTHASLVSSDLLRDFYTRVVPRGLRKDLGEFFTPEWIADRIVGKAIALSEFHEESQLRFLDPTCGSGTFLVAAMRRTIRASHAAGMSNSEVALRAVDSVTGFDVNPVSPLMARVNLLLTLGSLADTLPEIRFNVFQADSILIPEEPTGQLTIEQINSALTVPLVIGNISLPSSLATLPAIAGLARNIDASIQRNRSEETFRARLKADFPHMGVEEVDAVEALDSASIVYEKLRQLHLEGRDGVWAHVIEQSFAPRVLRPVDIVIGNPPWISWKNLPPEWRERSETTWSQWGLWQRKRLGKGTPMGDISSLLLARSISTYAPNGLVALLMPSGVLINDPGGRAIRRTTLAQATSTRSMSFAPIFIDDFSSLNPFPDAATTPVALYVKSGAAAEFPINGEQWTRKKARTPLPPHLSWGTAFDLLESTEQKFEPVSSGDPASAWRPQLPPGEINAAGPVRGPRYVWGQGFHTRGADGIYYCEIVSSRPYPGNIVRIRTRPDLGRNTAGEPSREALIETRFLWPLLRGANVNAFTTDKSGLYCIVPHDPEKLTRVITKQEAVRTAPHLFDYMEPNLDRLQGRSAYDMKLSADTPWGIQGTAWRHMGRSSVLVAARYMMPNSRPPAAVIRPREDPLLGFSTITYPNNKVNFLTCENLDEADYVAAFLNSPPAQSTIARRVSATTIAPSTLNALALPKYDYMNTTHAAIADVGRECRLVPRAWPALESTLAQHVVELLDETKRSRGGSNFDAAGA